MPVVWEKINEVVVQKIGKFSKNQKIEIFNILQYISLEDFSSVYYSYRFLVFGDPY